MKNRDTYIYNCMREKNRSLKYITEIFRVIVGFTFLFSGFVKSVDPFGFAYKIQDYLIAFDLVSLFPLALPAAIVLVVAELLVGILLLIGVYRKFSTVVVTIFMAVFLPMTLWIAIYNPVEDCGCFGDALIISNWDTFYKNVVLFIGALVLLKNNKLITPLFSSRTALLATIFSVIFGFSFAIYNTVKLPVIDFRPYHIGANIAEQMEVDPDNADITENVFIYSKNGEEQEFTEENYPWDDSTWVYVDMQTRLIKQGEKPKIQDFHINLYTYDADFEDLVTEDITDDVLAHEGYTFLMTSYFVEDASMKHLQKFYDADRYAKQNNINFYLLTSSLTEDMMKWNNVNGFSFVYAEADERVLKTMNRSNPGLMLLHNGVVVNKWDDSDVPDFTQHPIEKWDERDSNQKNNRSRLLVILLLFIVPLGALKIVDLGLNKKNN